MQFSNSLKYKLILFGPLLIILFHHVFCYFGHYGIDDMWYAKLAAQWSNGNINLLSHDHYEHRWALVGFTSLVYRIFGINDFSSGLLPMLFAIITCFLIVKASKENITISMLGILIFITNEWTLFYSDKLMPDTHVAFYFFCSMFAYYKSMEASINLKRILGILSSLFLFLGFLSKGTIILTAPIIAYFIIYEFLKRRNKTFWTSFILGGFLSLFVYLIFFTANGDAFTRLSAIQDNSYFNNCSYDQLPTINLLKRLGYELWLEFTKSGFIALLAFILFSLFKRKKVNVWDKILIIGVLASNFMSTSIDSYVPMCPEWRHFLFLVPIAAVAGSKAIYFLLVGKRLTYGLLLIFLSLSIFSYFMGYFSAFKTIYLPFFLMLGLLKIYNKPISKNHLLIFFALICCLSIYKLYDHSKTSKYNHQKDVFMEIVKPYMYNESSPLLISNHVQLNFCEYYLNFDQNFTTTFKRYGDNLDPNFQGEIIIFINGYTRYLSGNQYQDLPKIVKKYYLDGQVGDTYNLYENGEITILKMQATPDLISQFKP